MINFDYVVPIRLSHEYHIKPFNCGDTDLNGFLFDDALNYLTELMAITYIMEYKSQTAAYFCLLNDKVVFDTSAPQQKSFWNRFNRQNRIPNPKRRKTYPAVKIGRLAVAETLNGQGLGRLIIDSVKNLLTEKMDTACRFITVDAYQSAFEFYKKNGFDFLTIEDEGEATRVMYFDLKSIL